MTTEVYESVLHPQSLVAELKKNSVSHVVWLPGQRDQLPLQHDDGGTHH